MLTPAQQFGAAGEQAAVEYLRAHGYFLERCNYRCGRAEVDIIARLGAGLLIFVEVKTRSGTQFGHPETFVTERKRQLFYRAAEQYQLDADWHGDIRFDILALTPTAAGFRIEHFEDAF